MKQSRAASLTESLLNVAIGFGISLGAQMLFLPLLGVAISHAQNFTFALIMTAISIVRSFALRRLFEALHIRRPLSPFMQAVIAERYRQIDVEGWSAEHDDAHATGELELAASCYALAGQKIKARLMLEIEGACVEIEKHLDAAALWQWNRKWWKPADERRNLVKAGALLFAAGEKFDRERSPHKSGVPTGGRA